MPIENQAPFQMPSIVQPTSPPGIQVYPGTKARSSEADDSEPYINTTEVSRLPTTLGGRKSTRYSKIRKGSPLRIKKRAAQAQPLKKLKKTKSSSKSLKKGTSTKSLKSQKSGGSANRNSRQALGRSVQKVISLKNFHSRRSLNSQGSPREG